MPKLNRHIMAIKLVTVCFCSPCTVTNTPILAEHGVKVFNASAHGLTEGHHLRG